MGNRAKSYCEIKTIYRADVTLEYFRIIIEREQSLSSSLCRLLDIRIHPDDYGLAFNYQAGHLVAVGTGDHERFTTDAWHRWGLQVNFYDELAVFDGCLHGLLLERRFILSSCPY